MRSTSSSAARAGWLRTCDAEERWPLFGTPRALFREREAGNGTRKANCSGDSTGSGREADAGGHPRAGWKSCVADTLRQGQGGVPGRGSRGVAGCSSRGAECMGQGMSAPNYDSIWWEVEFGCHSAGNWMTTGGHYGGLIADTWQQVLKNVAESRGV